MQERRLELVLGVARPLDAAELLQALVAHAGVVRRQRAQLVPDLLGGLVVPFVAEPRGEVDQDPRVVARLAGRVERLAAALHAPLAVRDRALRLGPAGRRGQDDVRHLRGRGEEDVLDDEVLEAADQLLDVMRVGVGLDGVLAEHEQRRQLAALHRLEHLGHVPPVLRLELGAPHAARTSRPPRDRSRGPGSRAAGWGSRPCRRRPARCSGRAAGSGPSRSARRGRSAARG